MAFPYHILLDRVDLQNIITHAQGFDLSGSDEREMQIRDKEAYDGMQRQFLALVGEARLEDALDAAMGYLSVREDIMLALGMKMGPGFSCSCSAGRTSTFSAPPNNLVSA